jgi:septum formation protein
MRISQLDRGWQLVSRVAGRYTACVTTNLILASASPRRLELLRRVGYSPEVVPADVDEGVAPGESVAQYVERVAGAKAECIAAQRPGSWVLAADTTVELDGRALGKPDDAAHAAEMLRSLAGKAHSVSTVVVLRGPGGVAETERSRTEVVFRALAEREIEQYLESGEWRGKAGAYAIQGIAAAFVPEVRGCITNVIGLPLSQTVGLLRRHGVLPDYGRGQAAQ